MLSDERLEQLGTLASSIGVLLFGVALGMTRVGRDVQSYFGCGSLFESEACSALATAEQQATHLLVGAVLAFVLAFGVAYYQQGNESEPEPAD